MASAPDTLNPVSMYAPAGGMGPQVGGFAPTPGQRLQNAYNSYGSQEAMRHMAIMDPYSRFLTGQMAMMMNGGNGAAANNWLHQNPAMRNLGSYMAASGALGGGSMYNAFYGFQQAMGGMSGTSVRSFGPGGSPFNYGMPAQGPVLNDMTNQFKSYLDGQFRNPTGMMKTGMSHGFNMEDLGKLSEMLRQRGAWAGSTVGSVQTFQSQGDIDRFFDKQIGGAGSNQALKDMLNAQKSSAKVGDQISALDSSFGEKATRMISDAAEVMKLAQDVIGGPMSKDLLDLVEQSTGMVMTANNMQAVGAKFSSLERAMRAAGMNPQAGFSQIAAMGQSIGARIGDGQMGAMLASKMNMPGIFQQGSSQMAMANYFGSHGYGMGTYSEQEIAARTSADLGSITNYEKENRVASYVLGTGMNLSEGQRDKIMAAQEQLAKSRTPEEARAARQAIDRAVTDATGLSASQWNAKVDTQTQLHDMGQVEKDRMSDITTRQRSNIYRGAAMEKYSRRFNSGETYGMDATGASDFLEQSLFTFGGSTQVDFMSALKEGNSEKVAEIIRSHSALFGGDEKAEAYIGQLNKAVGKMGSGEALANQLGTDYQRMGKMRTGIQSKQDIVEGQSRAFDQLRKDNALGSFRGTSGMLENFVGGLFGGKQVNDLAVSEYLDSTGIGAGFKTNAAGGLELDIASEAGTDEIAKLDMALGGGGAIAKLFGVTSYEELQKAVATPEGMLKLTEAIKAKGGSYGWTKEGKFTASTKADTARGMKALQAVNDAQISSILSGKGDLTPEESEKIAAEVMAGKDVDPLDISKHSIDLERLNTDKKYAAAIKRAHTGADGEMSEEEQARMLGQVDEATAKKSSEVGWFEGYGKALLNPSMWGWGSDSVEKGKEAKREEIAAAGEESKKKLLGEEGLSPPSSQGGGQGNYIGVLKIVGGNEQVVELYKN